MLTLHAINLQLVIQLVGFRANHTIKTGRHAYHTYNWSKVCQCGRCVGVCERVWGTYSKCTCTGRGLSVFSLHTVHCAQYSAQIFHSPPISGNRKVIPDHSTSNIFLHHVYYILFWVKFGNVFALLLLVCVICLFPGGLGNCTFAGDAH